MSRGRKLRIKGRAKRLQTIAFKAPEQLDIAAERLVASWSREIARRADGLQKGTAHCFADEKINEMRDIMAAITLCAAELQGASAAAHLEVARVNDKIMEREQSNVLRQHHADRSLSIQQLQRRAANCAKRAQEAAHAAERAKASEQVLCSAATWVANTVEAVANQEVANVVDRRMARLTLRYPC